MNCMALDMQCAPFGQFFDLFGTTRSLNTSRGRSLSYKLHGIYSSSSGTPRLTNWSSNGTFKTLDTDQPFIGPLPKLDYTQDTCLDPNCTGTNCLEPDCTEVNCLEPDCTTTCLESDCPANCLEPDCAEISCQEPDCTTTCLELDYTDEPGCTEANCREPNCTEEPDCTEANCREPGCTEVNCQEPSRMESDHVQLDCLHLVDSRERTVSGQECPGSDSCPSSDSEEGSVDVKYIMPLASKAFETVMLELRDEETPLQGQSDACASSSDCSDDSFDMGAATILPESPLLGRAHRFSESECSQHCCCQKDPTEEDTSSNSMYSGSTVCCVANPRRVRFADHIPGTTKSPFKCPKRAIAARVKIPKQIKPILKPRTQNAHLCE